MWSNPAERPGWLVESSVARPEPWLEHVNAALTAEEMEPLRRSVNRGTPFGSESRVESTVRKHGLESTIRPRGRSAKEWEESSGAESTCLSPFSFPSYSLFCCHYLTRQRCRTSGPDGWHGLQQPWKVAPLVKIWIVNGGGW